MKNRLSCAAIVLVGISVCPAVHAQASNWYAGLSVGLSKVNIESFDLASQGWSGTTSNDEEGSSWSAVVGYRFNPYLSLEGGYVDFGEFSSKATITAPTSGYAKVSWDAAGWLLDVVGAYPLTRQLALTGRLGGVRTTTKARLSAGGNFIVVGDPSERDSEWNLRWGLGVQADLAPSVALRAGYDRTHNVGTDRTGGNTDIGVWSVGFLVRF